MDRWPNFFIVGAPKAGTTSLYEYLKQVAGIFMSPEKEPNYFNQVTVFEDDPYRFTIQDKKKYLELFKNVKNEKIIGDATPNYLRDPNVPHLIHKVSPNAKILITLRNPTDRIFSQYQMLLNLGRISYSTEKLVESLEKNGRMPNQTVQEFYTPLVKRYLDVFGAKRVKIIIFEEWIKNAKETIKDILKFLGVDYEIKDIELDTYNPFRAPRGSFFKYLMSNQIVRKITFNFVPFQGQVFLKKIATKKTTKSTLSNEEKSFLEKLYKEDVKNLQILLGRKLPWPTAAKI